MQVRGLTQELVDDLDRLVPEKCAQFNMSDREIWAYTGKRQLVLALKLALQEQSENIMEKTLVQSEDA